MSKTKKSKNKENQNKNKTSPIQQYITKKAEASKASKNEPPKYREEKIPPSFNDYNKDKEDPKM